MSWPSLLVPAGLLAGVSLAVIVLIHMRHRIPPSTIMPTIRFWPKAPRDHAERRRLRKPPLTLPFILQMAAAALITIGLARPLVEPLLGDGERGLEPEHVIVLLDGSTSMQALTEPDGERTRWDLARDRAIGVLNDWRAGDVVTVVTMGARLETTSASTEYQISTLRDSLRNRNAPGGRADLNAALTLTRDLMLPDRDNRVVVISDGAATVNPTLASQIPAPITLEAVGTDGEAQNVAITSLRSRSIAGQSDQYRVSFTIAAFGGQTMRVPYSIKADGLDVTNGSIDLEPNQSRTFEVNVPPGSGVVNVSAPIGDVLAADNTATIDFSQAESGATRILLITDTPGSLAKALSVVPGAIVDTYDSSTPGIRELAAGYDLVVFEGTTPAPEDVPERPMIFVKPQPVGETFLSTGFMAAPTIREVQIADPVLSGVDLNGVTFGETPIYQVSENETVLVSGQEAGNSGPLIWKGELNSQPYLALGFAIGGSNIGGRVAFPILVNRMVTSLTNSSLPLSVPLGEPLVFSPGVGTASVTFTNPLGQESVIPVGAGGDVTFPQTGIAGRYTVAQNREGQQPTLGSFEVNAGHPDESNLAANANLESQLQGGSESGVSADLANRKAEIWPWLVAGALLLIVAEWFASLRRNARQPGGRRLEGATP